MMWILLIFGLFSYDYSDKPYIPMITDITEAYLKKIPKEYELFLLCKGDGLMYDVDEVCLYFNCYKNCNLKQARRLYVNMVRQFLRDVNANSEIQPYLRYKPYCLAGFDLKISFFQEGSSRWKNSNFITHMQRKGNTIVYKIANPSDPSKTLIAHEELYEEALRIIQEEDAREYVNKD